MNSALTTTNGNALASYAPAFDWQEAIQQAVERRKALVAFTQKIFVEGHDYGKPPGQEDNEKAKNCLYKPGAEKLCTLFRMSPRFELADCVLDWTGENHNGEPFFYYQYRCTLTHNGIVLGEGLGSCNSWEKKYRYRNAQRVCPKCGANAIFTSKDGNGYYCWAKKDGCSARFPKGDRSIEGQEVGKVINPDVADIVNTLDKMAQKRALVAATLLAANASEFFTQDVEDVDVGFAVVDDTPKPAPGAEAPKRAVTPPPEAANEENRVHIASLCELLNLDPKEFYPKAAKFAVGGKNCPLLTPEELGKVTAEILAIWGNEQGVFNNLIHARSAFWKTFPEEAFNPADLGTLVEVWAGEIARRQSEQGYAEAGEHQAEVRVAIMDAIAPNHHGN